MPTALRIGVGVILFVLNRYSLIFGAWLFAAVVWSCSPPNVAFESFEDESSSGEGVQFLVADVSIEYLKSLYGGNSQLITQDIAIEGVITANDAFGEFPSSMIIEDSSGAIEIMCDFDCSTSGFVFGSTVTVLCNGLWLGATSGVFSLGSAPEGQSATGSIAEEYMYLYLRSSSIAAASVEPLVVSISSLCVNHILRYVQLNNLQLQSSTPTFCTRSEETSLTEYTYHTLQDLYGSTITLAVDRNVIYADDDIPTGLFSINAIVEYFAGEYMLKITNCEYR